MNMQLVLNAIAKISLHFAKLGARAASTFNRYQPELPAFFSSKEQKKTS